MAFDSHPARRPYPSGCWKRPTDTTMEDHWNLSPFGNESRIDRLMRFRSEACLADSGVTRPLRSSPRRHSELPLAPPEFVAQLRCQLLRNSQRLEAHMSRRPGRQGRTSGTLMHRGSAEIL